MQGSGSLRANREVGGFVAVTIEVLVERQSAPEASRNETFSRLYAETYERLVWFCRRLLAGNGDPEAVAQEAFARAWIAWDQYEPHRPLWPWLATIARRLCVDQRRQQGRRAVKQGAGLRLNASVTLPPDELLLLEEERKAASDALVELTPRQRRVVTLRDLDGWSYEEIASFEGVTVESVRGLLKRSRQALRQAYDRVLSGAPALVGLGWIRSLRRRVSEISFRTQDVVSSTTATTAGNVLAVAVAVALAGAPAASASPEAAPTSVMPVPAAAVHDDAQPFEFLAASGAAVLGATTSAALPPARAQSEPQTAATSDSPSLGGGGGGGPLATPFAAPWTPVPDDPQNEPVPDNGMDEPEDATFQSFTPSPTYGQGDDRTVFAEGAAGSGCRFPPCAALFQSSDGGATWQRLRALGYAGGAVILPPAWPDDPRIFVAGSGALQVSRDGGRSFSDVTPVGGPAAISPGFSRGDPRILVGQAPGWVYHADTGATVPKGFVPPHTGPYSTIALPPTFPKDPWIFVGTTTPTEETTATPAVYRCEESVCAHRVVLYGADGMPRLAVSPNFATDGTLYAWVGRSLFRSTDAGETFARLIIPVPASVQAVSFGGNGEVYLATTTVTGSSPASSGGLFVSDDDGASWRRLGARTVLDRGVVAVGRLNDGRLVAALSGAGGGGLLCSTNAGATWQPRCARL